MELLETVGGSGYRITRYGMEAVDPLTGLTHKRALVNPLVPLTSRTEKISFSPSSPPNTKQIQIHFTPESVDTILYLGEMGTIELTFTDYLKYATTLSHSSPHPVADSVNFFNSVNPPGTV